MKDEDATKNADERQRASRRLVSTAEGIPSYLHEKYSMPSTIKVVHVVHKTNTLPHFQVKLANGTIFEGKKLE